MANNNSPSDGTRPHPSTLKSYDTNTNTLIDTLNDIECEANNNDTIAGVLNMGNVLEDDRQLALEEQGIVQKHHHNNNNDNNSSGNDGHRKSGLLHRQHGLLSSTSTNNFDSDNGSIGTGYGHKVRCHGKLMRHREVDTGKVTNMELFFDLVYVYASEYTFLILLLRNEQPELTKVTNISSLVPSQCHFRNDGGRTELGCCPSDVDHHPGYLVVVGLHRVGH